MWVVSVFHNACEVKRERERVCVCERERERLKTTMHMLLYSLHRSRTCTELATDASWATDDHRHLELAAAGVVQHAAVV